MQKYKIAGRIRAEDKVKEPESKAKKQKTVAHRAGRKLTLSKITLYDQALNIPG